ncbi:MAG: hypothetical protein ACRDRA_21195 [Pseudonocardiaceae bacterium]
MAATWPLTGRADSFETGLHQAAVVGLSWARGLLLAGLLDQADQAAQRYRERCRTELAALLHGD